LDKRAHFGGKYQIMAIIFTKPFLSDHLHAATLSGEREEHGVTKGRKYYRLESYSQLCP